MDWCFLIVAGLFEVFWAVNLKYSMGFTVLFPSVLTVIGMIVSFLFLSLALRHLPLGMCYAVWTGIGILGTMVLGVFLFGESFDIAKVVCMLLILSGIVGFKLISA
jgi:quaternary ammonium compound-resistance protein SugE